MDTKISPLRRTTIVATLGPVSSDPDTIKALAQAGMSVAEELDARYVITFSTSGETARLVSHYRPSRPVLGLAPTERICRQLALPWGITPILSKHYESIEQLMFEGLDSGEREGTG